MINYEFKTVKQLTEVSVTCNKCKKVFDNKEDLQEFFQIKHHTGFWSIWGDMKILSLDLCQDCTKILLGEYINIEDE